MRIVRITSQSSVASNVRQITSLWMNDVPYLLLIRTAASDKISNHTSSREAKGDVTNLVVSQFHARNHDDPTISSHPVIVANQTAFTGRTFTGAELRHSEPDVRNLIHGSGVENGNSVPARLNLNGKMALEAMS